MKNQAFAFLKPHAMSSQAVVTAAGDLFERRGVSVAGMRRIPAATLRAKGLYDRHVGLAAARALEENPAALPFGEAARARFRESFEEELAGVLSAGRLLSPFAAMERFSLDPDALLWAWSRSGAEDFGGELYVGRLSSEILQACADAEASCSCGAHHGSGHDHGRGCSCGSHRHSRRAAAPEGGPWYVVNGFYPAMREPFADPGGPGVLVFRLGFDLSWRDFNEVVIGDENPAGALEESLRGYLYDRRDALGIRIDRFDNVLHASVSPFDALCEKIVWLAPSVWRTDPLCKALLAAGADAASLPDRLLALRDEGGFAPLVRGADTPDIVAPLQERLRS